MSEIKDDVARAEAGLARAEIKAMTDMNKLQDLTYGRSFLRLEEDVKAIRATQEEEAKRLSTFHLGVAGVLLLQFAGIIIMLISVIFGMLTGHVEIGALHKG